MWSLILIKEMYAENMNKIMGVLRSYLLAQFEWIWARLCYLTGKFQMPNLFFQFLSLRTLGDYIYGEPP